MSYTPPPLQDVPPNRPPEMPPNPEFAPVQYPPAAYAPNQAYYPADPSGYPPGYGYPPGQPVPPAAPSTSGCRWGCIAILVAMFAVVFLIGAVLISVLTSGTGTLGNILGGLGDSISNVRNSIEDVLGTWTGAPPRRAIVIPQVERLQKLAELTTVKFNYAGVVTVRQDIPPLLAGLYGNEQTLVAVVSVRAGIDMSRLTQDNILYDETTNSLTIMLPPPVLQECFMDDSKSYVVENRTGVFVGASPALNDEARRYAIQQFRNQALEEKILEEAQKEGEVVIREFMTVLNPADAPNLQLSFQPADPAAIPPTTCQ